MFTTLSITVLILSILFSTIHLANAYRVTRKRKSRLLDVVVSARQRSSYKKKGMSVLIPCYNEESIIMTAIQGIHNVNYQDVEIMYINDGSTDRTMDMLIEQLSLVKEVRSPLVGDLLFMPVRGFYKSLTYPNVYVLDKNNGGKADSLNAGIAYSEKELVITLDADSVLSKDALSIVNRAFQDEDVVAAGGMVHILQGRDFTANEKKVSLKNKKRIVSFQILEYLKGFYILKQSMAEFKALAVISGAFGIFNRQVMHEVGGFRRTIGEDIDITLRFQEYIGKHKEKKMIFIPEAECYTECPENWKDLYKQRIRWQKSFMDSLIQFKGSLIRTIFKRSVSFFFLIDSFLVAILSSVLAVTSTVALIILPDGFKDPITLSLITMSFTYNIVLSVSAMLIAKKYGNIISDSKWYLAMLVLIDVFFYRFITLYYLLYGSVSYFWNKHSWNKVERTGTSYDINVAEENA